MHYRIVQIQKLLFVYSPVHSLEVPRHCPDHRVLQERRLHNVYLHLAVLAQVNEAIAAWAALDWEQRIEHKRVKPVVVESMVYRLLRRGHRSRSGHGRHHPKRRAAC